MSRIGLLSEEDKDQLLKELAFGFDQKYLAEKYGITVNQLFHQKINNSSLFNIYRNFFRIKPEIVQLGLTEFYQFILNLLWDHLEILGESKYKYRGKIYYRIDDLIEPANRVLEREGLPTVKIGDKVNVKY